MRGTRSIFRLIGLALFRDQTGRRKQPVAVRCRGVSYQQARDVILQSDRVMCEMPFEQLPEFRKG